MRLLKKLILLTFAVLFLGALALTGIYLRVESVAKPRVIENLDELPERKVGMVLGCAPMLTDGRPNLYFSYRIQAAAEIFNAGKVQYLLVSGDNSDPYYDEPTAMKKALMKAGVPEEKIVCDFAGLRTLDSVVRAKEVFLQDQFLLVSQPFHCKRAIYLGKAHGIDITAYPATDVSTSSGAKTQIREVFARVKALLDVTFLQTQPKHLGEPEPIGSR